MTHKNTFKTGNEVECINISALEGNNVMPPLELKKYTVKGVCLDSAGNQHLDVGLKSSYNFIRSYETKENLPDGDKIHWCHPSRFKAVS